MPHYPTHPPFLFSLTKKHGDIVLEGGVSSAADAITFGGHVGTHMDALCHFSCGGKLHGGVGIGANQGYAEGVRDHSIDTVQPIVRRGVLLDIARDSSPLPKDFVITPDRLDAAVRAEGVTIQPGDVVLLRTGWAQFWNDPVRFITGGEGPQPSGPGPELAAAQWLSARGIFAAGSDTVAFEKAPSSMQVHVHLLVESGIHIIECLNLEALAQAQVYEFVFVALPLKIRGGTGSPIRPIAISGSTRTPA
jgi:kynurenine formamidase